MKRIDIFLQNIQRGIDSGASLFLILSEVHSIMPEQQRMIELEGQRLNSNWVGLVYPKEGFKSYEMDRIAQKIYSIAVDGYDIEVIFISPIPYLVARLAYVAGWHDGYFEKVNSIMSIKIFHNDDRKSSIENGHLKWYVSKTGWLLQEVNFNFLQLDHDGRINS